MSYQLIAHSDSSEPFKGQLFGELQPISGFRLSLAINELRRALNEYEEAFGVVLTDKDRHGHMLGLKLVNPKYLKSVVVGDDLVQEMGGKGRRDGRSGALEHLQIDGVAGEVLVRDLLDHVAEEKRLKTSLNSYSF